MQTIINFFLITINWYQKLIASFGIIYLLSILVVSLLTRPATTEGPGGRRRDISFFFSLFNVDLQQFFHNLNSNINQIYILIYIGRSLSYYKIDNESLSRQHGTCNKVGSGFTLRTPATLFLVLSMGTPTAAHNFSVQHWHLRHKTFAQ